MFGLFKTDPLKKLQKTYEQKLEAAMQAQRSGDIKTYSTLSEEAQAIYAEIESIKKSR